MKIYCSNCGKDVDNVCSSCWRCDKCCDCRNKGKKVIEKGMIKLRSSKR